MRFLRLINPLHVLRLERDLARLTSRHEAMRADVVTYADIVGRQAHPASDAGLLRRAMLAENDVAVTRMHVHAALRELERGRRDLAACDLRAILGEAFVDPAPVHLVDVVA